MNYILGLLAGLAIGSFVNVVADLLASGKPIKAILRQPRSRCNYCRKTLSWYELLPVLSFLILKGQCAACHKPIPLRYTVVELLTGLLGIGLIWYLRSSSLSWLEFLLTAILLVVLVTIGVVDWQSQQVPEGSLQIALYLVILLNILARPPIESIFGGVLLGGASLAAFVFIKRGEIMGEADLLMALILGLWLGFPTILITILLAFILGGTVGLILILARLKKRTDTIGFLPFLVLSSLVSLFFGQQLTSWYINLLL